jgi:polar amino acid transport system substrate-binding protein
MRILAFILLNLVINRGLANVEIVLAAEDSWPPFSLSDGTGISQQYIDRAYQKMGVSVKFVVVPYARALHMTQIGEVDGAFNVTKQASTKKLFNFGKEPLLQASASFYYPPDKDLHLDSITDAPDGLIIALIIGYEYGEQYEQSRSRLKEIRVSNQRQIISLLLKNRVDVAIMFDDVANFYLQQMHLANNAIEKGKINHTSDIYVAFNKDKPQLQHFIDQLDAGLRIIKAEQH